MMRFITRRGRLLPLVVLSAVLLVTAVTLVGAAQGAGTTATTFSSTESQTANFTVSADDLGDFSLAAPKITSPAAIVVSMDTGKVVYEWDAYKRRPMASTTKIMTAILVLEQMDLDEEVRVSQRAAATVEPKTWLRAGDVLTVEELLYALMVRSANSAAMALAEACVGSVEAFIRQMNYKAAELGMDDTRFANPSGLDAEGHYSTAADMATVARYAMKNAMFRKLVSTQEYTLSLPGRKNPLVFKNTNGLLGKVGWVTGVKTGLTPRAEQCLVCSGTLDDISIISVVLGQPSTQVCWKESRALMEYGFAQFKRVTLLEEGTVVAKAEVPYQSEGVVQLVTESTLELELYKKDSVTASITVERDLVCPVTKGEVYGHVSMIVGGEVVGMVDLVADRSFEKATLGSKISYYFGRLGRWLGGLV